MTYSLIILIFTALVSFSAFNNNNVVERLILWPKRVSETNEYYRLLTSGFIHADMGHLIFNMIALYFFGGTVETYFRFFGIPTFLFLILYFAGIITASLPSFIQHKNNSYYRALGASGGVSAVVFSAIYFDPWNKIYIMFIPIGIPAILFAIAYLAYSWYMGKKGNDNIGHDAHFWGAVFGFIFTLLISPDHGSNFIWQLLHPRY